MILRWMQTKIQTHGREKPGDGVHSPKTLLSSTEVPVDFLWGGRWRHVFPQNALPVAFLSFILGMHLVCMGLKRRPCPQGCDRQEPWGITRQEQV